jgi:hypothetical protein
MPLKHAHGWEVQGGAVEECKLWAAEALRLGNVAYLAPPSEDINLK